LSVNGFERIRNTFFYKNVKDKHADYGTLAGVVSFRHSFHTLSSGRYSLVLLIQGIFTV
jgi:hypothetical protein